MSLYAKTARSYGTNAIYAIFSATAPEGSRMIPVAPSTARILQRLVSAGYDGIRFAPLDASELHALADIEHLGIRLDRVRRPGFVCLVGTVTVIDQRAFTREVA